jgi:site-specific DNA-cytosine methylase
MIDLLLGGSPCQGFSFAGKQLNFSDPRSKLFFDYVKALETLKPKYFLLENVKMKKEYQDIISKHLGVEPIEINSALVSAQNRKRLYWTNISVPNKPKDKHIKLLDILDNDVDESYFINDETFNKLTEIKNGVISVRNLNDKFLPIENGDGVILSRTWQTYMPIIKGKSHCIRAMNPNDSGVVINVDGKFRIRKFTENEVEKLQTIPINYTYGLSPLQRKKLCGNGWTVDVIAHILSFIPETYLHTVVSLFDGISCGQVALERAGKIYNQYYASEIDKDAIAVTQKNYPHTMQLGDVTKIDWNAFLDRLNLIQKVS